MASTYVNNLRLEEIGTGEQSGTWGDTTNTNLEIIGQAVAWGTRAIANASTDNITIADGALDADRCLGLKLTGGGQACTVTLLPNTSSKTWFMYNATAAALTFTCGSGANVIIPANQTKVIATDGLGSGGVVHDLLTAVNLAGATVVDDLTVSDDLTVTDDAAIGGLATVGGTLGVTGAVALAADVTFADGADIITASAGTSNFRAGVNAGNSIASGGNYNTVVGDEAGTAITTGDNNVAVGYQAGDAITTGTENTAAGVAALGSNTTGVRNEAFGNNALFTNTTGGNNTAVGRQALYSSTTASYNVAVGSNAGTAITTGINNTLIGSLAGDSLTDADYNTVVGYNALSTDVLGSRSVAIGFEALKTQNPVDGSNNPTAVDMYNVGIGFNAGTGITTGINNVALGGLAGTGINTGGGNICIGKQAGVASTVLTTGGNNIIIGLGANTGSASRNNAIVMGEAVVSVSNGQFTFGTGTSDSNIANGATSISAPSDQRYKEEIADATAGLAFIKDLRPVTFKWKKEKDLPTSHRAYVEDSETRTMNDSTNHGFIAQEVKTAIDAHSEIKDGFDMWCTDDQADGGRQRIADGALIPMLVKAIQELEARVATLEG